MPGAPKQFDYDTVRQKALEVFWANGYEGTSIQDLVDAMGISRASMYDTFGNKRDLFMLCFQQYCQHAIEKINQILNADAPPLENLKALLLMMTQQTPQGKSYGCFANNVATELGPHDEAIAALVCDFWQQIETQLSRTLESAIERNELSQDINVTSAATLVNSLMQGLVSMSKVGVSKSKQMPVVEQLIALLSACRTERVD